MHPPEIRPRFRVHVAAEPADVLVRVASADPDADLDVVRAGHHVILTIPEDQRHFWSPQLTVAVETEPERGEGVSLLRCLFGPQPAVWTGFAAFYAFSSFVAVIGGMFGAAQMTVDNPPSGFIAAGIGLVAFVVAYLLAIQGQRLGRDEMLRLRESLDHRLDGLERIEPSP